MERKELEELKEKALKLNNEYCLLKLKVNAQKSEYARIIKNNFVTVILPYMEEMNDFIQDVRTSSLRFEESVFLINTKEVMVKLRITPLGIHIFYREWKDYGLDIYVNKDTYKKLTADNWISLADLFDSVDSCNIFIERINEWYTFILTRKIERLEIESPSLAETLQNLAEKISKANCIEEKEDGKIEININGKIYIGTLKEI